MVDFDKTYKIDIDTSKAVRNVKKLGVELKKIEDGKIVKRLKEIELGFLEIDKAMGDVSMEAKKARRELDKTGKVTQREIGKKATKAVKQFSKATAKARIRVKTLNESIMKAGSAASSMGRKMTMRFTLPVIGAGAASIKFALDLNKSMANVSTLMDGGIEDVERMKKGVQALAIDTGKSTTDLADGLYNVVSALGESNENLAQLDTVARAAVAGVSSTTEALDFLSSVTKAYGDTSDEALKKASDLGFMTVKLGKTTFPELAASMGKVTPLAATLKTSQEELFAAFATLTGVTGNTAEVSTQLSAVYSAMLKPTDVLSSAVEKLGFSSASAMMKERGFIESVQLLGKAAGGSEAKLAKMLGRKEALLPVLSLLGKQSGDYNRKLREIEGSLGATQVAFDKQTKGINAQGHSWEKTKQRFVVFAQRMGDKLLPVLGRLFDRFEPWLEHLEKMDDATLSWWMNWVGVHAAIGPVLAIVGSLASKMAWLTQITRASNLATRAMAASTATMGNTMAGNVGKVKGMSRAMKGLASLGVIAVGVELAFLANKMSGEHSEAQAEKRTELQESLFQSRELLSSKNATPQQKLAAATRLERSAKAAATSGISAEGAAEAISSIGSGRVRTYEQTIKQVHEAATQRQRLLRSAESDVRGISGITAARSQAAFNPLASQAVSRKIEGTQGAVSIVMGDTKINMDMKGVKDLKGVERVVESTVNRVLTEKLSGVGRGIASGQN